MDTTRTISSNVIEVTSSILERREEAMYSQFEAHDLLEPQYYPDPALFRDKLNKKDEDLEELKTNLDSSKTTLQILQPYIKLIGKDQGKMSDFARRKRSSKSVQFRKKSGIPFGVVPDITERSEMISSIHETAEVLRALVKARNVVTYLVSPLRNELFRYSGGNKFSTKIELGTTISAYAAVIKQCVFSNNITSDLRFPQGVGSTEPFVKYVLCVPIKTPDDKVVAVYELTRDAFGPEFSHRDAQMVMAVTSWVGTAAQQNTLYATSVKQHELTNYLLQLTCHYHSPNADEDKTLADFLIFARETIAAERCRLYLVEKKLKCSITLQEYSQGNDNGNTLFKKRSKTEIENDDSPLSRTIFHDEIFNNHETVSEVNPHGEPQIRDVLCVPIKSPNGVIGAIQLVNKSDATAFTKEDVETLTRFAAFFAINIYHLKVHDRGKKPKLQRIINSEMLYYHIKPCLHDQETVLKSCPKDLPDTFFTFLWYPTTENMPDLVQLTISMFHEVLGNSFMTLNNVPKFVLTVRNCYRENPYHNFLHAFSVAHAMANIITRYSHIFTGLERNGLMVAALCHDLDHRGYTNNFIQLTKHYLANLYESSLLENHHFAVTKMILRQCGMFKYFEPKIYNEFLEEIYECIIATDLSLYFQCRMELMKVADEKSFTFKNPNHRRLVKSLMMTACDLSGQTKPLPVSTKITETVYEEFFRQGDIEKRMEFIPLPTMDRDKQDLLAENQVQFLSIVVIPCVETVCRIFNNLSPMVWESRALLAQWKELLAEKEKFN